MVHLINGRKSSLARRLLKSSFVKIMTYSYRIKVSYLKYIKLIIESKLKTFAKAAINTILESKVKRPYGLLQDSGIAKYGEYLKSSIFVSNNIYESCTICSSCVVVDSNNKGVFYERTQNQHESRGLMLNTLKIKMLMYMVLKLSHNERSPITQKEHIKQYLEDNKYRKLLDNAMNLVMRTHKSIEFYFGTKPRIVVKNKSRAVLNDQNMRSLSKIYSVDKFKDKPAVNIDGLKKTRKINYSKIKLKHKMAKPRVEEKVIVQDQIMSKDNRKQAFATI